MAKSTHDALMRYYQRQLKNNSPKKKNGRPEKLVEKEVLAWCREQGWFINVVESKAVFSAKSGIYHTGQTVAGTSDLIGCTNTGLFVAIELKSSGRRSTLREAQRRYICEVISRSGFAVCVDSVECLVKAWSDFQHSENKKQALLKMLPQEKEQDNKPLFEDD